MSDQSSEQTDSSWEPPFAVPWPWVILSSAFWPLAVYAIAIIRPFAWLGVSPAPQYIAPESYAVVAFVMVALWKTYVARYGPVRY